MNRILLLGTMVIGLIPQNSSAVVTLQGTQLDSSTILAIGSLPIRGVEYDVSFEGSFGERMFLGDTYDVAFDAGEAIRAVINDNFSSPNSLLRTAGGSGYVFRVTFNIRPPDDPEFPNRFEFYEAQYAAGWLSRDLVDGFTSTIGAPSPYGEATFRLAIPNSIPHTIPESSVLYSLLLTVPILLSRKRTVDC